MSAFKPIPPIIKQRAKELLEVIREVVRENLSRVSAVMDVSGGESSSSANASRALGTVPVPIPMPMVSTEEGSAKQKSDSAKLWGAPRECAFFFLRIRTKIILDPFFFLNS